VNLVYHHFARFGLQMHIGSGSKTSRTECGFFPAPGHFKLPALPYTTPPPGPSSSLPISPKLKQESKRRNGNDTIVCMMTQRKRKEFPSGNSDVSPSQSTSSISKDGSFTLYATSMTSRPDYPIPPPRWVPLIPFRTMTPSTTTPSISFFVQYPSSGKLSRTLTTRFQLNSSRLGVTTRVKEEVFFRTTRGTWRRTSASLSQVLERMVFSPHGHTLPLTTPTGNISFLN